MPVSTVSRADVKAACARLNLTLLKPDKKEFDTDEPLLTKDERDASLVIISFQDLKNILERENDYGNI